jgi:hypothetical protein
MDKKVLAICWLNGQFKAMAVHKGAVKSIWESPQIVDENADFQAVLNEAVNQTGYNGVNVCILISSRKLMYHLIEVPPVSGADLEYYIERKANQLKAFDEPLSFCYIKTLPTRISNGVLVNIYPRSFLEKLTGRCNEIDLHLSRMFTLQSVMRTQLGSLNVAIEEPVVLAADVNGSTALLIGRKDGEVYFGRTIYGNWKVDPEYVCNEIMRSVLFVKQQFGIMATRVFLYGTELDRWKNAVEQICGLPAEPISYPSTAIDWLKECLKLSEDSNDNLVTADLRQEPQTRLFLRMTGFLAVLIIAGIGIWIAFVEKEIKHQKNVYASLVPAQKQLEETKNKLFAVRDEIQHRQQFVKLITDNIIHPVPGWFFGYLCDVFPDDLVLKELEIRWTNGLWHVRIVGVVHPADDKTAEQALAFGMQLLQNRLERSPFHFKVIKKSETPMPAVALTGTNVPSDISSDISSGIAARKQAGISMLGEGLANTTRPDTPTLIQKIKGGQTSFWLEGVMQ